MAAKHKAKEGVENAHGAAFPCGFDASKLLAVLDSHILGRHAYLLLRFQQQHSFAQEL